MKNKDQRPNLYVIAGPNGAGKTISGVELALERIRLRVQNGGHHIPEDVVRRRFGRSLPNFVGFYKPLADSWTIFDNSGDVPKMIAFEESGKIKILDPNLFNILLKV